MKVVLYARVSTEKQARKELSISEQIRQMQSYCAQYGHEIVKIYREKGASARDEKRPIFQKMLQELLSGEVKAEAMWSIPGLASSEMPSKRSFMKIN